MAPAVVRTANVSDVANSTTTLAGFSTASGTLLLVIAVCAHGTSTSGVLSVMFGNRALKKYAAYQCNSNDNSFTSDTSLWWLPYTDGSTADITAIRGEQSGGAPISILAICLSGTPATFDGSAIFRSILDTGRITGNGSLTLTTQNGDLAMGICVTGTSSTNIITPGAGVTEVVEYDTGGTTNQVDVWLGTKAAVGASTVIDYTTANGNYKLMFAFAVMSGSGTAAPTQHPTVLRETHSAGSTGTTLTLSLDGSGGNMLVVACSVKNPTTLTYVSGITFNGVALSALAQNNICDNSNLNWDTFEFWYLPVPYGGTANLIVTKPNGLWVGVSAFVLRNANAFGSAVFSGRATEDWVTETVSLPVPATSMGIAMGIYPADAGGFAAPGNQRLSTQVYDSTRLMYAGFVLTESSPVNAGMSVYGSGTTKYLGVMGIPLSFKPSGFSIAVMIT